MHSAMVSGSSQVHMEQAVMPVGVGRLMGHCLVPCHIMHDTALCMLVAAPFVHTIIIITQHVVPHHVQAT